MGSRELPPGWEDYTRQLGDNITMIREARKLSQEDVARVAGVTRHTYQRLEKGWQNKGAPSNPTLFTILSICWALGVRPEEVLPPMVPRLLSQHSASAITAPFALEPARPDPRNIYGTRLR